MHILKRADGGRHLDACELQDGVRLRAAACELKSGERLDAAEAAVRAGSSACVSNNVKALIGLRCYNFHNSPANTMALDSARLEWDRTYADVC